MRLIEISRVCSDKAVGIIPDHARFTLKHFGPGGLSADQIAAAVQETERVGKLVAPLTDEVANLKGNSMPS